MNKEKYNNELALSIKAKIEQLNMLITTAQANGLSVEVENNCYTWGQNAPLLSVCIYELKEYPTEHRKERTRNYCNRNIQENKPNLQKFVQSYRRFQHDSRVSGKGGNKEYAETPCDSCLENQILPKMRQQHEEELLHSALLKS